MIEEVIENTYRIELPLPDSPLKFVNSYVIKATDRNLIVDTGVNREKCNKVMREGLKQVGVDLRRTDFFITHLHLDHIGLVSNLTTEKSTIYFNQPDTDRIESIKHSTLWSDMIRFSRMNGYPKIELGKILRDHWAYRNEFKGDLPFRIVEDKDVICVGDYLFNCIQTPGHSKGHMCLYEPEKKILFSGDHLLNDVTSGVQLSSGEGNPLKEYLSSLDKIYELEIDLVLPGHRGIFGNCRGRIEELKDHHQKRIREIISILEKGRQNAYQVASQMSWDIVCDSWDSFPGLQKWFAVGETMAHMRYLEEKGMVQKKIEKEMVTYSLIGDY